MTSLRDMPHATGLYEFSYEERKVAQEIVALWDDGGTVSDDGALRAWGEEHCSGYDARTVEARFMMMVIRRLAK